MSLLINAIEAMPNGGNITIVLTEDQDLAIIKIIDEGTGILEKDLPNIFEPFYSTKEASKGTGMNFCSFLTRLATSDLMSRKRKSIRVLLSLFQIISPVRNLKVTLKRRSSGVRCRANINLVLLNRSLLA